MSQQLERAQHGEILSDIENIGKDEQLYEEVNFTSRLQAIDYLEFHVIDRLEALYENKGLPVETGLLKQYANKVKCNLEEINERMFHHLRGKISQEDNKGKLLTELICEYSGYNFNTTLHQEVTGYDSLDIFLDGLLTSQKNLPAESKAREPGMIYYQKTPARIILELIKRVEFKQNDVFFDLGSGLGQVAILVNLLASVDSRGVEFEPAYCSYARACSNDLLLKNVEFINADARYADYSSGTIFFMYTPFEGQLLREVLQNLNNEAKTRRIKVFTYGSCSGEVAKETWLVKVSEFAGDLVEFFSC